MYHQLISGDATGVDGDVLTIFAEHFGLAWLRAGLADRTVLASRHDIVARSSEFEAHEQ